MSPAPRRQRGAGALAAGLAAKEGWPIADRLLQRGNAGKLTLSRQSGPPSLDKRPSFAGSIAVFGTGCSLEAIQVAPQNDLYDAKP